MGIVLFYSTNHSANQLAINPVLYFFNTLTRVSETFDIKKVKDIRNEIQSLFKYHKSSNDGVSKFDKERVFGRFLMRRGRSTIDALKRNFERLN